MPAPIRPQVWPPAPSGLTPGRNDVRAEAQKAFFQAALTGKAAAPPPAAPQTSVRTAAAAASAPSVPARTASASSAATASEPEPDRFPRPGSIIDIRV